MSANHFSKEAFPNVKKNLAIDTSWEYIFLDKSSTRTLVLLAGGELNSLMWYPLTTQISNEFNLLLIDVPKSILTKEEIVQRIDNIVAQLNIENFSLLGYAFGGFICLYYLIIGKYTPDRLILSHTTFDFDKLEIAKSRLSFFKLIPNRIFKFLLKKKGIIKPANSSWRNWALSYQKYIIKDHIDKKLVFSRLKMLLQLMDTFRDLYSSKKKYNIPIYTIDSFDDPTYETKNTEKHELVKQLSDNTKAFVFERGLGGHHTPICSPELYADKIKEILG